MTTNYRKNIIDPCENCSLCFMAIMEDCSFCARFVEACEFNNTTPEQELPWIKKTTK